MKQHYYCTRIAPKCIILHVLFKNFPGLTPLDHTAESEYLLPAPTPIWHGGTLQPQLRGPSRNFCPQTYKTMATSPKSCIKIRTESRTS